MRKLQISCVGSGETPRQPAVWRRESARTRRSYAHLFCHKTFSLLGERLSRVQSSRASEREPEPGTRNNLSLRLYSNISWKLRDLGHPCPIPGCWLVQTQRVLPTRFLALGIPHTLSRRRPAALQSERCFRLPEPGVRAL